MPKTILLADDSVTIQKVVGISFANEDVVLLTVDNGDDAVTRARAEHPDLVLADIAMPGLDGYAVCEAVKADPSLRHVPVLLLSGTFETFDEERARRVGADGHITKPFEAQALVDRVNDLLARSEAARPVGGAETTVIVSEQPSASEAFEFFDDEFAETSTPTAVETVLLPAEPELPVAADPIEFDEADEADLDSVAEPMAIAQFEDAPLPGDGHATMLFDTDAVTAPPPVPRESAAEIAFGTTIESRTPLVSMEGHATRLLADRDDPADALDLGFEAEPEGDEMRDTAAVVRPVDDEADEASADALFEDDDEAEPVGAPPPVPTPIAVTTSGSSAHLDALRGELREHLEKVAWEAFGDLSEKIVRETVSRVEAIAWEVIPQMAEALIREEIRRLQSED